MGRCAPRILWQTARHRRLRKERVLAQRGAAAKLHRSIGRRLLLVAKSASFKLDRTASAGTTKSEQNLPCIPCLSSPSRNVSGPQSPPARTSCCLRYQKAIGAESSYETRAFPVSASLRQLAQRGIATEVAPEHVLVRRVQWLGPEKAPRPKGNIPEGRGRDAASGHEGSLTGALEA